MPRFYRSAARPQVTTRRQGVKQRLVKPAAPARKRTGRALRRPRKGTAAAIKAHPSCLAPGQCLWPSSACLPHARSAARPDVGPTAVPAPRRRSAARRPPRPAGPRRHAARNRPDPCPAGESPPPAGRRDDDRSPPQGKTTPDRAASRGPPDTLRCAPAAETFGARDGRQFAGAAATCVKHLPWRPPDRVAGARALRHRARWPCGGPGR